LLFVKDAITEIKADVKFNAENRDKSRQVLFIGFHPYKVSFSTLGISDQVHYCLFLESETAEYLHAPLDSGPSSAEVDTSSSSVHRKQRCHPALVTLSQSIPLTEWVEKYQSDESDLKIRKRVHKKDIQVEAWKKERWNRVLGGALRDSVEGFALQWFFPVTAIAQEKNGPKVGEDIGDSKP
jgi:hypothetical protein